jgi:TetR/AcrR family transcriptional regulator, lmrAB and yxaGH operons repressor
MVVSAASLIGSRGVGATSLSDVLESSRAPRGSIYHHFPNGKKELVGEAMRWTSEQVMAHQRRCSSTTAGGVLEHFVNFFRPAVVSSHCRAGCPIAGVVVDTYADEGRLLKICRARFRAWTGLLTSQLVSVGVPSGRARALATTTLASVEGALILCRAEKAVEPLDLVATQLRQLATVTIANPRASCNYARSRTGCNLSATISSLENAD